MTTGPMASAKTYCFAQIHIDAARNSTDDFNPFHEPRRCSRIQANPYPGPIVLGFELEQLLEHELDLYRDAHREKSTIASCELHYSNYQLTFADALVPGERFGVDIKPTLQRDDPPSLGNRVIIRKDTGIVVTGHKRETAEPLYLSDWNPAGMSRLREQEDRSFVGGSAYFLKRKFLNTGNAKNFLAGSLCDQSYYFDELDDRVRFPEMFPVALLSCALLEKAMQERHDFMRDPMVYMSHRVSVDRRLVNALRSNDVLHMLVEGPFDSRSGDAASLQAGLDKVTFRCFGLVKDERVLYRAEVDMAPLAVIVTARGSARD